MGRATSPQKAMYTMILPIERDALPFFLKSFEDLTSHFDEHFGELGSNERGDTFLSLAEKVIPLMEEFSKYPPPTPAERKTHDGGVDLLTTEIHDGQLSAFNPNTKFATKRLLIRSSVSSRITRPLSDHWGSHLTCSKSMRIILPHPYLYLPWLRLPKLKALLHGIRNQPLHQKVITTSCFQRIG